MNSFITLLGTQEFRKAHDLPNTRVETHIIAKDDPERKTSFVAKQWWDSDALATGTSEEFFLAGYGHDRKSKDYLAFRKLSALLLSIGGSETCFPCLEEDMAKILERGKYYRGHSKMMVGRPSQCHANCCELWELNHKDHDIRICTGYALSEDGMWRQHSWLVHYYETATQHRRRIIETTAKRVAYYGFEMTDDEAREFCENNF